MYITQTFNSILLQTDISCCAGEADPPVALFPDINNNHPQGRLSRVALVHSLNYQSPLALGQSLQLLCGLDVSSQGVDSKAPHRVGKTIKHRAISPEVLVLCPHGGQHSAAGHAADRDVHNKWVLNEEGGIVVHILYVDGHLSSGVTRVYRGRVGGTHLKGVRGGPLSV